MVRTLTGSRIRKARKSDGWTQTALASAAGISPSYLNLIEHNRRAATGDVLTALASALGTTTETLSRDGDSQLISTLHEAAARLPDLALPPGTLEDLASRNPEMAELLASTFQRLREVEGTVTALSDRLTHDPYLSENVHGMLSTITAIRSSASILHQMHDLTPEQDNRFRRSVHEESLRLSSVAEGLAEYLSRSGVDPEKALTPEETLDRFLTRRNWVFDALDQEAATLADIPRAIARSRLSEVISEMLGDTDDLGPAQTMARDWLDQYASDALTMPLRPFHQSAKDAAWDPPTLARTYQTDLHAVFRRLASLRRSWIDAPAFGLFLTNASGYPLRRQPLPSFALPRHGNACPLWPVFEALSAPTRLISAQLRLEHGEGFTALAVALPRPGATLGQTPDLLSAMLIVSDNDSPFALPASPHRPVGPSCRICAQTDCPARAEASLLA